MPAFNLQVDDSSIEDVTINQTGDRVTVAGTLVLAIKNTGVLPIFNSTVTVSELSVTGVTALEDESKTISSADDVEFDFSFTQNSSRYLSTAQTICNGGQMDGEFEGSISGFILGSSFDDSFRESVRASCNLENGTQQPPDDGGELPSEQPPEQPHDDQNGEQPPDNGGQQPPEEPQFNAEIINIDAQEGGYDDPIVNTTQTYQVQQNGQRVENYPTGDYVWVWEYGNERTKSSDSIQGIIGSPAQTDYNWDSTGEKTITVTVSSKDTNQTVFQIQKQETIQEQNDSGLLTQDTGSTSDSGLPSMDQAAEQKDREY